MSSSSGRRRFHVRRHPVVVDIGCSCRRPKLSSLLNFSLYRGKSSSSSSKSSSAFDPFSPSTSLTTTITNSSFSPSNKDTSSPSPSYVSPKKKMSKTKSKKKKPVVEESVAVEKVSSDPYLDFKDSMLQMIVEKEIYQWEDLRELLHLFLSLNSPYHHQLIIRAFTEIWNGIFSGEQ